MRDQTMTASEYELLLLKYLRLVIEQEGVAFFDGRIDLFTAREMETLQRLADAPTPAALPLGTKESDHG